MTIHPIQTPRNPEERVWNAINDLRREVRQMRQTRANQPQTGFNIASGGVFSDNAIHELVTVDVYAPFDYSLVGIYYRFTDLHVTGATTVDVRLIEDTNFPSPGTLLGSTTNTTNLHPFYPKVSDPGGTFDTMRSMPYLVLLGEPFSGVSAGPKTYKLCIQRSVGTGNISALQSALWVVVL